MDLTLFNKFKKGFILPEVFVAIFILVVGVGAAFALINQTLIAVSLVKERFIASYLAQEGIEIVRNIRDSNWIRGANWRENLNVGNWEADYTSQSLSNPYDGEFLKINDDGFYNYNFGSPTKFQRRIKIEEIDANRLKVNIEISWQEKGRTHHFNAISQITNWAF